MKKKNNIIIIAVTIIFLLILTGFLYWFLSPRTPAATNPTNGNQNQQGFQPFGRNTPANGRNQPNATGTPAANGNNNWIPGTPFQLPILRLLSNTPVGGYGASTTATTTVVRWIDRGRGNIYEATYDSPLITTLSNTLVPRMYASAWNRNLTAFVGSLFQDGDVAPTTVYAELIKTGSQAQASSSQASVTPYELHGKNILGNMIDYAISPDRTRLFLLVNEKGMGVGYISNLDGTGMSRLFSTPLTQLNVDWPTSSTITVTTKGSAYYDGYMYLVNAKTGVWTKALGPAAGLSAIMSHDGKYILASQTSGSGIRTYIYSVTAGTSTDAVIRTLADKCAWGNFYKDVIYCGVPTQLAAATYPDAWNVGSISSVDKIWQINAVTGELHLVSSIIDQADRIINAFNLGLDPNDDFLFFMNKNDLSLWSLDLTRSQ